MRALLLTLAVSLAAAAAPPPAKAMSERPAAPARPRSVEDVPLFGTVEAEGPTRLLLRGALTPARRIAVEARSRAVVADIARRFAPATTGPKRDVAVCVFEKPADYRAFALDVAGTLPSELGFYLPGKRLVVVNLKYGLRNLSHELVHPLVGDDFPAIPSWLNEGLGSLYGGSDLTPTGLRFTVNYRMRDVQKALKTRTLPTLSQLATSGGGDVYGDEAMTWYGLSRGVLLYLASRGELGGFYLAARGGTSVEAALTQRIDEARFHAFARTARVGAPVKEASPRAGVR